MRKITEWVICPRCKGGGESKWYELHLGCSLCDGCGKLIIREVYEEQEMKKKTAP